MKKFLSLLLALTLVLSLVVVPARAGAPAGGYAITGKATISASASTSVDRGTEITFTLDTSSLGVTKTETTTLDSETGYRFDYVWSGATAQGNGLSAKVTPMTPGKLNPSCTIKAIVGSTVVAQQVVALAQEITVNDRLLPGDITTVTFNKEGDYVLKLTASDGEKEGSKEITVHGIPSDGTVNVAPQSSASASYTNGYQPKDNAKKVIDGQVVYANTPNETWNNWGDSTGVEPWLQLKWAGKVPLKKAKVFFWTDGGGVPMVSSWKLQYADADGNWQDVKLADGQSYTVNRNEGNEVKFADAVETDKLRVVFPKGAIVGASEFEAYAIEPVSVDEVNRLVQTGSKADDLKPVSYTHLTLPTT